MSQLIEGLESDTVAIAARTQVKSDLRPLPIPFVRLRSRNLFHRILPKQLRPLSPLSGSNILLRTIGQTRADRILCHFGTEAVEYETVWQTTDVPLFVHFHGYDTTFAMLAQDGTGRRVHAENYRAKIVALASRATFIANSKHTVRKLVEGGVPADRITLNYLGVPVPTEPARKESGDVPVVLYLGRLVDCKAPALAVEAFSLARKMGAKGKLIIAGDGPELPRVKAAVARSAVNADIAVVGEVESQAAQALMKKCSVFIVHNCIGEVTRQEEALNLAVLEAMAVCTPICGTATGGVSETNIDGETGFLTQPLNVEEQAKALFRLLGDETLRHEMGFNAWDRVRSHFNQATQIETLREILRRS